MADSFLGDCNVKHSHVEPVEATYNTKTEKKRLLKINSSKLPY